MIVKRASTTLGKVARSPLLRKGVGIAKSIADVGKTLDIPLSGALAKGLGIAEDVLTKIQKA